MHKFTFVMLLLLLFEMSWDRPSQMRKEGITTTNPLKRNFMHTHVYTYWKCKCLTSSTCGRLSFSILPVPVRRPVHPVKCNWTLNIYMQKNLFRFNDPFVLSSFCCCTWWWCVVVVIFFFILLCVGLPKPSVYRVYWNLLSFAIFPNHYPFPQTLVVLSIPFSFVDKKDLLSFQQMLHILPIPLHTKTQWCECFVCACSSCKW